MTITEEQARQQVQQRLGAHYGVVKLGRYWVIGTTNHTPKPWLFVTQAGSLDKAIRQAEALR